MLRRGMNVIPRLNMGFYEFFYEANHLLSHWFSSPRSVRVEQRVHFYLILAEWDKFMCHF